MWSSQQPLPKLGLPALTNTNIQCPDKPEFQINNNCPKYRKDT